MRSVVIHAALLAVALLAAFTTWTAEDRPETDRTLVEVWDRDPAHLAVIAFRADERTVVVERRNDAGDEGYLWAVETMRTPVVPPATAGTTSADPAQADTADSAAAPSPPPAPQVEEYPVGEDGVTLFDGMARLRALRDLGEVDEAAREAYGLAAAADTVTLRFDNGDERVLVVGSEVVGGGDRYTLDTASGRVYVLDADLFRPLELAASLRLTRIQPFMPDDVERVTLRAGERERVMQRRSSTVPGASVWTPPDSDRQDQTFANFMDQLERLWVARYRTDLDSATLQPVATVEYFDAGGDTLGTLELLRAQAADSTAWFLLTRVTVVPGEVYGPVAERIEQDLETILRGGAEGGATD